MSLSSRPWFIGYEITFSQNVTDKLLLFNLCRFRAKTLSDLQNWNVSVC